MFLLTIEYKKHLQYFIHFWKYSPNFQTALTSANGVNRFWVSRLINFSNVKKTKKITTFNRNFHPVVELYSCG